MEGQQCPKLFLPNLISWTMLRKLQEGSGGPLQLVLLWALGSVGSFLRAMLWRNELNFRRFPMEPFLETLWGPLVPISAY